MESTEHTVGTGNNTADTAQVDTENLKYEYQSIEYPDPTGIIDGQPDHDGLLQTALRVLQAINERTEPSGLDVAILQLVFPAALPHDELACEVIQSVTRMRCRSETRGHLAWKTG